MPRISKAQSYNVLLRLDNSNGGVPTNIVQGADANFYGTGITGGHNAGGRIFEVTPAGSMFTFGIPPFITTAPASGPIGATIKIYGSDLSGATDVTFNGGVPATFTIVSPGEIDASVPAGALWGPVKVVTPAAVLISNVAFRITP